MTQPSFTHSAFSITDSFRQGDLDRNCGLYAVLNGFRLALGHLPGLTTRSAWILHGYAVDQWNSQGLLLESLIKGISFATTLKQARRFAKLLSDDKIALVIELPPKGTGQTLADVFAWIEESLSQDCPVVVRMRGELDHFSVVGAVDQDQVSFFDSGDLSTLPRNSFGIKGKDHSVTASGLFRIRATPKAKQEGGQ